MKNVFYFFRISEIGGIEQFFAYLAEKYADWDITIYYRYADPQQLNRLRQYVRVVQYFEGQQITCDNAYFCFNRDIINNVHAKKKYLILHGDYAAMVATHQMSKTGLPIENGIDGYFGVSQVVCDSWKKLTGLDCTLVYNPFIKKPKKKILKLVYCGRLTSEKGGDLVNNILRKLENNQIDYILYVYSNVHMFGTKNVVYMGTRLDAGQFLTKDNFDFILIPSKNEGYCYSLVQALANGLPAIITPCPVFKELGCDETNSIQIDFEGNNFEEVIPALYKDYNFKYEPKKDTWNKILVKGKSTYEPDHLVLVQILKQYYDLQLGRTVNKGEKLRMYQERANQIIQSGFGKLI